MAFSNSFKDVVVLAKEFAEKNHATKVETEHLLYGLIAYQNCQASKLLTSVGITVDAYQKVINSYLKNKNSILISNVEFSKTVNSTNGDFNDYFSFTPEIKLSQYLSLKETLSANFAKHIKIAEFYISINPFGKRDIDRFNIEMGTSSIFDQNNSLIKNRFKIMTKFKL